MKLLITGASGYIGSHISHYFSSRGHYIYAVTRKHQRPYERPNIEWVYWDYKSPTLILPFLSQTDVVINLAGVNLGEHYWTTSFKEKLRSSRLEPTRALVQTILSMEKKPPRFLQASAIGYYGYYIKTPLNEEAPNGDGFLAKLCKDWESESDKLEPLGVKRTILRFGIVLDDESMMFKRMEPIFKLGLGAVLGSGEQLMSWIYRAEISLILEYMFKNNIHYPIINMVSPHPIKTREFYQALADAVGKPLFLKIPRFLFAFINKEMSNEFLFASHYIVSKYNSEFQENLGYSEIGDIFKTI